jgi:putative holliday junction resolvase
LESVILNLPETNIAEVSRKQPDTPGRLVAVDLGTKRVGVAVSDELQITANPLDFIERRSWKDLLRRIVAIIEAYDARGLVIGLPLSMDGTEGLAAAETRRIAENFRRSLSVPIYLQDERLTTFAARSDMRSEGIRSEELEHRIDSESAAVILRDFMSAARP